MKKNIIRIQSPPKETPTFSEKSGSIYYISTLKIGNFGGSLEGENFLYANVILLGNRQFASELLTLNFHGLIFGMPGIPRAEWLILKSG